MNVFTGLIQDLGSVEAIERIGGGARLVIRTPLGAQLAPGDSIAVNGVCLTAIDPTADSFAADAIPQTLDNSTTGELYGGTDEGGGNSGDVLWGYFVLDGTRFMGINGGPHFHFNEAVSFMVHCKDQAEVDYYWDKLGEGGDKTKRRCGWLADKFGLSWQIVPDELSELLNSPEKEKRDRAYSAMMRMEKLDVDELRKAFNGE